MMTFNESVVEISQTINYYMENITKLLFEGFRKNLSC